MRVSLPSTRITIPTALLTTPDAWEGPEIAARGDWKHVLSQTEITELLEACEHARKSGKSMYAWTRRDFPLSALSTTIRDCLVELDSGQGFILLKGFPVVDQAEEIRRAVFWGLGLHIGRAISQNTSGQLLCHIRDTGADPRAPGIRLYKTRAEQDFHTDSGDIVGLFCLHVAKSGGISRIVSSVTIFNEMMKQRPDLVPVLFEPFPFEAPGGHEPGRIPWYESPICHFLKDRLHTFFLPWYIRQSQRHARAPRLSPAQMEVVAFIERTANDRAHYLNMDFEPGDIQLLRNASILHKRTEYEDWPEPERKRHLLRLWLMR